MMYVSKTAEPTSGRCSARTARARPRSSCSASTTSSLCAFFLFPPRGYLGARRRRPPKGTRRRGLFRGPYRCCGRVRTAPGRVSPSAWLRECAIRARAARGSKPLFVYLAFQETLPLTSLTHRGSPRCEHACTSHAHTAARGDGDATDSATDHTDDGILARPDTKLATSARLDV